MKKITKTMGLALSLAAAGVMTMTGCGGSSSDGTPPPPGAVSFNGKFIDDAVGGVSFNCSNVLGITAADGSFGPCPAGTTVLFSIGGLTLGSSTATGDGIFFVTDIVGTTRDDIGNEEVLKIASLLQSADSDGDPSNGITVPPEAAEELSAQEADIADLSSSDVSALTGALVVTLKATYPDTVYVSPEDAEAHLAVSVENIDNGTIVPPTTPTGSQGGF